MRFCLAGSKVAIKSFVFSIGLVAEKQQFCATRLSDFHELSRAASPWGQITQFFPGATSVFPVGIQTFRATKHLGGHLNESSFSSWTSHLWRVLHLQRHQSF